MPMKRTSLFLDAKTLRDAQRLAKSRGVSMATLVREAMAAYLAGPPAGDPLPSIAGSFSSGTSDTSERVDELLWRDPHA